MSLYSFETLCFTENKVGGKHIIRKYTSSITNKNDIMFNPIVSSNEESKNYALFCNFILIKLCLYIDKIENVHDGVTEEEAMLNLWNKDRRVRRKC